MGSAGQRVRVKPGFARNFLGRGTGAPGATVPLKAARRTAQLRETARLAETGEDARLREVEAAQRALQEQQRAEDARGRRVDKVLKVLRSAVVRIDRFLEDSDPVVAARRREKQEAKRARAAEKRKMWREEKDAAYAGRLAVAEAGDAGGAESQAASVEAAVDAEAAGSSATAVEGAFEAGVDADAEQAAEGEDTQTDAMSDAELARMKKDEEGAPADPRGRVSRPVTKEDIVAYCLDNLGINLPLDCLDLPEPLERAGEHGVRIAVPGRPDCTLTVRIVGHRAYSQEQAATRSRMKSFKSSKDSRGAKSAAAGAADAADAQFYE